MAVEAERVRQMNQAKFRPEGAYVLYWTQMNRRVDANHALLYAAELANRHNLPVLYYEGLTCSYPNANDRLHTFVLEGVPETAKRLKKAGIGYCFYLRRRLSDPNDVVYTLAEQAAAVITDDYPAFVAREHNRRVPDRLNVPYFVVDSSCVVPMSRFEKREYAAYTIRPKIKRLLGQYLKPADTLRAKRRFDGPAPQWHTCVTGENIGALVAASEIDHSVKPSLAFRGGRAAAERQLRRFLTVSLSRYSASRNEPSAHATSGMSPYLHFGQISSLEIALAAAAYAHENKLIADEFSEELIVRRELAFNYARFVEQPGSLDNLPGWARESMRRHASDPREAVYTREQFERAATHDELWNATQSELLLRGKIHGYYRMYWGKKILEWSAGYQEAADTMVYLHDRYALDGRDPNTYSNILWCFGLHDRPWGRRPVFGTLRSMTAAGMRRKTKTSAYIDEIRMLAESGIDPWRTQ